MKPTQAGLTEPVRLTYCHRCGHPILRAHADGIDVRCDPAPADLATEALALLAGRHSYDLVSYLDGHLELAWRHLSRIRAVTERAVVLQHRCTTEIPADQARRLPAPVVLTTKSAAVTTGDAPPF